MTNTIHICLDLETWGKKPGCDLRSIGACVFDPATGTVCGDALKPTLPTPTGVFYAATDNPGVQADDAIIDVPGVGLCHDANYPHHDGFDSYRRYALIRDPETVDWWNKQSADAQAAFADPMDLRTALERFSDWLREKTDNLKHDPDRGWHYVDNVRIWSHGAAFDPPILAAAYDACGLPVPWHYRAPRDTRTCFDMAGIDNHSAWLQQHPGPLGIWHHALDDAISEARAVCAAYARLRVPHDVRTHRDTWFGAIETIHQMSMQHDAVKDEDDADSSYWAHERKTFIETFDALEAMPNQEQ